MEDKNYTGLIPNNKTGVVIESAASHKFDNQEEAKAFYKIARQRLLYVNDWHHLAGIVSANFKLIDSQKQEVNRNAQKGDYFKIDIPGPGSNAGGGFDWVRVEDLEEVFLSNVDSVGLRVRPSSNPNSEDSSIAHFYSAESTSTFIVTREDKTVTASIYDRNTKPNTDSKSITDKIRHVAAGLGAISGFSKIQWQRLANGIVNINR